MAVLVKVCIVVGGSGYIGTKLCERLLSLGAFDKIIVTDISDPVQALDGVVYIKQDVRDGIYIDALENIDKAHSWLFNFAAIHREPGHSLHEYFDTNVVGADKVNDFLERSAIANLFFTSSIAPYGRSREVRSEVSPCYPETPYGISKWKAESIHRLWLEGGKARRLIICRPSVIYGPGDPGNVLRMIKGIQKGSFFIPGEAGIVKSHGYIYGLLDSMLFTMRQADQFVLYNYSESPTLNLGEMVEVVKKVFPSRWPTLRVPLKMLLIVAHVIRVFVPSGPVHPVRVKKAAFPTNVKPGYLISKGFEFKYGFSKSLLDWIEKSPEDFR
jgi:nucleoside-diphosphate-sugar epimerase